MFQTKIRHSLTSIIKDIIFFAAIGQVLVVPLRVNVNLKASTVEEKEAQRQVTRSKF